MCVVAVDKKIIVYMAAKSVVLSTEDHQVVGQGCLPLSSTRSSPCSQQLALLALFTATGKRIWPIISLIRTFHLSGMVFLLLWPDNRGSTVYGNLLDRFPSSCMIAMGLAALAHK